MRVGDEASDYQTEESDTRIRVALAVVAMLLCWGISKFVYSTAAARNVAEVQRVERIAVHSEGFRIAVDAKLSEAYFAGLLKLYPKPVALHLLKMGPELFGPGLAIVWVAVLVATALTVAAWRVDVSTRLFRHAALQWVRFGVAALAVFVAQASIELTFFHRGFTAMAVGQFYVAGWLLSAPYVAIGALWAATAQTRRRAALGTFLTLFVLYVVGHSIAPDEGSAKWVFPASYEALLLSPRLADFAVGIFACLASAVGVLSTASLLRLKRAVRV